MPKWRWDRPRDARILRLFHGDLLMLVIDKTRLHIVDKVGPKKERLETVIGCGIHPSPKDQRLILKLLNGDTG